MANFMLHPMRLVIMAKETNVAMTNFLAVHSKLRTKKMAQIMILEAIRRSRAENLQVAFYHSAQCIPTPFLTTRSSNRLINIPKLLDVRYTSLPQGMTRKEYCKKFELPNKDRFQIKGNLRRMEERDVKEVLRLYNEENKRREIYLNFSKAQIAHLLLPKEDIVMTYVVEDAE